MPKENMILSGKLWAALTELEHNKIRKISLTLRKTEV
jgi:hypothetical protein